MEASKPVSVGGRTVHDPEVEWFDRFLDERYLDPADIAKVGWTSGA